MSKVASRRAILAGIAAAPALTAAPALAAVTDKVPLELTPDEIDVVVEALRASSKIKLEKVERIDRQIEAIKADPIFAAIERYKKAEADCNARGDFEDDLEEKGIKLTPAPDDHRTPEMAALVEEVRDARAPLASAVPTTIAGLLAYLDYVASYSTEEPLFDGDDEWAEFAIAIGEAACKLRRAAS